MQDLDIIIYSYLSDNYGFLLHSSATNETAAMDCGESSSLLSQLESRGLSLTHLFITHHHADHTDGLLDVKKATDCVVYGPDNIDGVDHIVSADTTDLTFAGCPIDILHTPGHTLDMLNYHFPDQKVIFVGDTLFALGCGRLLEGDAAMMWNSLQCFRSLPKDTKVYFCHEYTLANAKFAITIEPENEALLSRMKDVESLLSSNKFTVPSLLSDEYATNPFLRADQSGPRQTLGMEQASDADVFAEIRRRKDNF